MGHYGKRKGASSIFTLGYHALTRSVPGETVCMVSLIDSKQSLYLVKRYVSTMVKTQSIPENQLLNNKGKKLNLMKFERI